MIASPSKEDPMTEPIACSLSASEARVRAQQSRTLTRRYELARERIPGGLRLQLHSNARPAVESLIESEAGCCAFLEMRLRSGAGRLELTVTAPEDAAPIIEGLFA
jgi:hypothetical protein